MVRMVIFFKSFGLSEVVWHVDAVVGTGGLVVAGGLVEAGELEGSGKDITFCENMASIKKFGYKIWEGNILLLWFGQLELQKPHCPLPLTWIPVKGFILVEHHLLPFCAIAQPNLK